MILLSSLTHHATLFVKEDRKTFADALWNDLQKLSPAHIFHEHTVIDIEVARELITWAQTAYQEDRVALLSFHIITHPAQNALLKILEEPRVGVRFILVTTNREALIPTLYSRLQEQSFEDEQHDHHKEAKVFLETSPSQRMKLPFVTALLQAVDEEKRKDREGVRMFILSLATVLGRTKNVSHYVERTIEMASFAGDTSSSGKAIVEYLALLLPQVKV